LHDPQLIVDEANIAENSKKIGVKVTKRVKKLGKSVRKDFNKWHRKGVSIDKLEPSV